MNNRTPAEVFPPGDFIREELEERGWSQADLARIMGRDESNVSKIIAGKTSLTLTTARELAEAFGTSAEYWLNLEAAYQLSQAGSPQGEIRRRAKMWELAPIGDMQRRGWIKETKDPVEIEREFLSFFGVQSVDAEPRIGAVTRKSNVGEPLTPSQRAWCFRVQQLARAQLVAEYREENLAACAQLLRKVAAYPQEAHKVPQALASYGIRFVIVEPLPSSRVDGVALWLDDASPVIGMSLRYDRVDYFWFTLLHELVHIKYRDEAPLDGDLADSVASALVVASDIERRANEEAATTLVPKSEMESFILRVGPLYSKDRINRFANRMKIHPGIIVGQLQRRKEIGYAANREMLAKVRHFVTPAAVTDGWGSSIDPRSLK